MFTTVISLHAILLKNTKESWNISLIPKIQRLVFYILLIPSRELHNKSNWNKKLRGQKNTWFILLVLRDDQIGVFISLNISCILPIFEGKKCPNILTMQVENKDYSSHFYARLSQIESNLNFREENWSILLLSFCFQPLVSEKC